MKKIGKRIGCFCLAVLLTLLSGGLVSCRGNADESEIPKGMKIASCMGADYRLFVPQTWNLNTDYGISGAYQNLSGQSTVSVGRYEIDEAAAQAMAGAITEAGGDPERRADRNRWYFENVCLAEVKKYARTDSVTVIEEDCVAATLGGDTARRYHFTANVFDADLHYVQVLDERAGAFYVFTFTANQDYYEMSLSVADQIIEAFIFSDTPYEPPEFAKELDSGKDAPAGMKSAFSKDVPYRFYVPGSWEIDLDEGIYSAYVPIDRANVSVVPYLPETDTMSAEEYRNASNEMILRTLGPERYEELSAGASQLGGREAIDREYRITTDGEIYHARQLIASYRGMIYTLTYTAKEADFASHIDEFNQIIGAFSFR